MKKYLIFDLDGTLINSRRSLINIISAYLFENYGINKEKTINFLNSTNGVGLAEQIKELLQISLDEAKKISNEIYSKFLVLKGTFFPGVPEKLKKLSKKYVLFLSTGNSTDFATKNFKEAGIYDDFEYILGSDKILKSKEHIDFFKEITLDSDFEKYSVFIGDGENDRFIAKECKIDFIHIDPNLENKFQDKYEIASVSEIEEILKNL